MGWIFENVGFLIFLFIAISMVRAMAKAMRARKAHEEGMGETEEQRNLRRIREGIRRKIAERRGGAGPVTMPPPLVPGPAPARRVMVPPSTPPLDPFGGPGRRILTEMERRMPPRTTVPPPIRVDEAAMARQEQLAQQMRTLEEARLVAQRRAAVIAATTKAERESEAGALISARQGLLTDLRDPQGLRRAFVLREVLGPPVALR